MYIYEMHQHTAPCSHCGKADPALTVRTLAEEGFSGMVITNHFFSGNTGIDRDSDWKDFVAAYEEDWLKAKAEGDRIGFDVIFGIEEHIGDGKEILLYGITPQFLYDRPFLRGAGLDVYSRETRSFGGLVFQAHPFRKRDYIPDPDGVIDINCLDGIESYNAANPPEENERARRYAEENGLLQCAGSDAHREHSDIRFGIMCDHRIRDSFDLAETLRSCGYKLYLGNNL